MMILNKKNILFLCAYQPEYGGNFIRMLSSLSDILRTEYYCNVYFVFPKQRSKTWIENLKRNYIVEYTTLPYEHCTKELKSFFDKWSIDIVHTHFEAYDIPSAKVIRNYNRNIKMIWHLHDYLSLDKKGLKYPHIRKFFSNLKFWKHYGYYGKNAFFIGVSDEVTHFATHYRNNMFKYPSVYSTKNNNQIDYKNAKVVINGIDINRLSDSYKYEFPTYPIFLSFGGEAKGKGISTILSAAEILYNKGYKFTIYITKGITTESLICDIYNNHLPDWLKLIEQTENIQELFLKSTCYISASLKETMSMAIAEASIFGLPVIQSDIPGTWWNSQNPSTFIFEVGNPNALSKQMEKILLFDKCKLKEFCIRTSETNKEILSMNKWCYKIIQIYKDELSN